MHFTGRGTERGGVTALVVNLQQFETHGLPVWILLQRFLENFFGLGVAAIGHVHIGFGYRINFIGIDRTRTSGGKITLE